MGQFASPNEGDGEGTFMQVRVQHLFAASSVVGVLVFVACGGIVSSSTDSQQGEALSGANGASSQARSHAHDAGHRCERHGHGHGPKDPDRGHHRDGDGEDDHDCDDTAPSCIADHAICPGNSECCSGRCGDAGNTQPATCVTCVDPGPGSPFPRPSGESCCTNTQCLSGACVPHGDGLYNAVGQGVCQ